MCIMRAMTKNVLALVGLSTALMVLLALRITPWYPTDDAYISFRYAENWVAGHGLVFNPGERVEGYSNFLYVVFLAGASKLGLSPPLASRLINSASVIAIFALIVFALPGPLRQSWARFPAALVFALSAHNAANVLSGLEAPLFAALLLGGALASENRRGVLTPILFLALSLTRPEGIALAAVAGAAEAGRALLERDYGELRRVVARWSACAVVPYLAYFLWRVIYYGQLLPNSVYAKLGFSLEEKLHYSSLYLKGAVWFWPLLAIVVAGWLARGWLAFGRRPSLPEPRSVLLLFLSVAAIATYTGAGDPYRGFFRYPYPAIPLLLVLAVLGTQRLLALARGRFPKIAVTTLAFGWLFFGVVWAARPLRGTYTSPLEVRERLAIGFERFFQQDTEPHDIYVRGLALGLHGLGAWLAEHARDDELASMAEVGIAPFYSGVRVVDTSGLVTEHIARLPGRHGSKADKEYVFGLEPDYFVFKKRANCMCSGAVADVELFRDPRLRHGYDFVRIFPDGHRSILLFKKRQVPFEPASDLCNAFEHDMAESDGAEAVETITGKGFVNVFNDARRQELLERLRPASRGETADFEVTGLMWEWLSQWRCYNLHLPVRERDTMVVRHRVSVPQRGVLTFLAGMPADPRNLPEADDVVFEISVEGESESLFRQVVSPQEGGVWQEHQIDLGRYTDQTIGLELRVYHEQQGPQRGVFNAGWAEMMLLSQDEPPQER